jgi:chitodextrinase
MNITAPTDLVPIEETSSTISLAWTASTEASGTVAGYYIYRNGAQVGTSVAPSFIDTGLSPSTAYFYTVAAYDTGDNVSPQSTKEAGTTSYFSTLNNISSTFASNLSEGISSYFFPAPPTVSISANPTTITQGQTATITWTSTNASACTASDSLGNGSIGLSGSLSETPPAAGTYTYTIACSGPDGATDPASSAVVVSGVSAPAAATSSTAVASGSASSTASLIAELQLLRMQLLKLLIAELQVLLRQAQAQGITLPSGAAAYLNVNTGS